DTALTLAGQRNPCVARVVAINPYNYVRGRGIARSSPAARLITLSAAAPVLGETVMRLRTYPITRAILLAGVVTPASFPATLLREMHAVGNRKGHYRAFLSLLRHGASWEAGTVAYRSGEVPVLLLWGEQEWSRPGERAHERGPLPST